MSSVKTYPYLVLTDNEKTILKFMFAGGKNDQGEYFQLEKDIEDMKEYMDISDVDEETLYGWLEDGTVASHEEERDWEEECELVLDYTLEKLVEKGFIERYSACVKLTDIAADIYTFKPASSQIDGIGALIKKYRDSTVEAERKRKTEESKKKEEEEEKQNNNKKKKSKQPSKKQK